jgi:N-dimethylarginine dimethylaminohydrolase
VIERVENLESKLRIHALGDVEVFQQGGVELVNSVCADVTEGKGQSAQVEGELISGGSVERSSVQGFSWCC